MECVAREKGVGGGWHGKGKERLAVLTQVEGRAGGGGRGTYGCAGTKGISKGGRVEGRARGGRVGPTG